MQACRDRSFPLIFSVSSASADSCAPVTTYSEQPKDHLARGRWHGALAALSRPGLLDLLAGLLISAVLLLTLGKATVHRRQVRR